MKTALVCGASQGIGRATSFALAANGVSVFALARSRSTLEQLIDELPCVHASQKHGFIEADVSDHDVLKSKLEALCINAPITILINNTAGPAPGSAFSAATDAYLDTFNRHLIANQICLQAVLPSMRRAQFGRVINVISTSVKEPIKNLGVSNTIRGAVAAWAKSLASELGPFGITVNNVLPGYTKTQRLEQILQDRASSSGKTIEDISAAMIATVPVGRFAEADEIAAAIAFLASPAAAYINGINLPVDGGRTQSL